MTRHRHLLRPAALVVALLAAGSLATACGSDDEDTPDGGASAPITVTGAWARTSPSVAKAAAVYLTLANDGERDDELVGASVDATVAAKAELHETVAAGGDGSTTAPGMSGEMMTMRPVEEIPLPAGEKVALEPGGYHVMLVDLASPLEVGTKVRVTLRFEHAANMVVTAAVRDVAP